MHNIVTSLIFLRVGAVIKKMESIYKDTVMVRLCDRINMRQ